MMAVVTDPEETLISSGRLFNDNSARVSGMKGGMAVLTIFLCLFGIGLLTQI